MNINVFSVSLLTLNYYLPLIDGSTIKSGDVNGQKYLEKFGYIKNAKIQQLVTAEQWHKTVGEALRKFQRFAGIPETGVLDEETKETMSLPRCGVSDEVTQPDETRKRRKRYALQGSKWRSPELTYKISKYPSKSSYSSKLSKKLVDEEIRKSLEVWSKHTPLKFTKRPGRVQLDISFHSRRHGDRDPFDGAGGTLAHAFFPQFGGDAHFDDDEYWTLNSFYGTNMFQVAAHEFGHSLGLSHSNVKRSLMAPFYRGYQKRFSLHKDDIEAIQKMYGKPKSKPSKPKLETPEYDPDKEDGIDNTEGRAEGDAPDLCQDSSIDAVVKTQNMFSYVFKGNHYWRILDDGIADGYPRKISTDWDGLPGNIDAALTWKDGRTFFFKDDKYWRFTNKQMHPGYPKKISVGFEGIPSNVDAAFVNGDDRKTYFFKGNVYYEFESKKDPPVSSKYPRSIKHWRGVPNNIDAVFEWKNGKNYFFDGSNYYRLKEESYSVESGYPRPTSIWWFGCKSQSETISKPGIRLIPIDEDGSNAINSLGFELRFDGSHDDDDNSNHAVIRSTDQHDFTRADVAPETDLQDNGTKQLPNTKKDDKKSNSSSLSRIPNIYTLMMALTVALIIRHRQ